MFVEQPDETLDVAFELFLKLVREHPELQLEFEGSTHEFFPDGPPTGDPRATLLAARRHLEWFVVERHSPALFKTPIEGLRSDWFARAPFGEPDDESAMQALSTSFTGVFLVTDVRPGEGLWVRDLAGFGEYPIAEPHGSKLLQSGDLIVGRLFQVPGEAYRASRAAGFVRDAQLAKALERDLDRLRRERGGSRVLHVSQLEIERMFFGGDARSMRDPLGEARAFLADGGLPEGAIAELLAHLKRTPFDTRKIAIGANDVLGEILNELAFETHVDLTHARRLLGAAWASFHSTDTSPSATRAQQDRERRSDARAALETFEQGRAAGADLESLFRTLEADLALDPDEEDDDVGPAPDFPGVVGAMVEEFLWERSTQPGSERDVQRFSVLRKLGEFAQDIGVFEALSAADLLRFVTFWLPERRLVQDAETAGDLVDALDEFCAWAESAHEVALKSTFGETLGKLRSSLPRIVEANEQLEPTEPDETGELFEVVVPAAAESRLRDRSGTEHRALLGQNVAPLLRTGDRLRGRIELDGRAVIYRLYPPESAGLLPT